MSDASQFEITGGIAVAALYKKGEPTIYVNPDLTGEKKSVAFELYFGNVSYCLEIDTEKNELDFLVDDEIVGMEDWFDTLAQHPNKTK